MKQFMSILLVLAIVSGAVGFIIGELGLQVSAVPEASASWQCCEPWQCPDTDPAYCPPGCYCNAYGICTCT